VTAVELAGAPRARELPPLLKRTHLLRRPVPVASLVVIVGAAVVALLAPLIAPYGAAQTDFSTVLAHPSWHHLLGTDDLGRDVFSRVVWGARVSMTVGVLATSLALVVAVPLGLVAGYAGGAVDSVVTRAVDVMLAFPFVILAIGLAAILGASLTTTTVALAVVATPALVRITRGETLALREAEFVSAAVAIGAGRARILSRHVLPNMTGTLLVQATVLLPRAIVGEATLSFLGVGVRPPRASWGGMLRDAQPYLSQAPLLAIYPGLAVVVVALAFNLLGDALRDVLDPRTTP
jgi:peptide/nickel transport system permease protein